MTQIEQQLNSKFEEILKEIRTNTESNLANDEEDADHNKPSTSNQGLPMLLTPSRGGKRRPWILSTKTKGQQHFYLKSTTCRPPTCQTLSET